MARPSTSIIELTTYLIIIMGILIKNIFVFFAYRPNCLQGKLQRAKVVIMQGILVFISCLKISKLCCTKPSTK